MLACPPSRRSPAPAGPGRHGAGRHPALPDALVELARETFGVKTVLISLIDHDRQWFKARIGLDAEQTPRDLRPSAATLSRPANR